MGSGREIKLEVPPKRSDNNCMIIKTDKETRDRMCWLLRREIANYAVHGAKTWLGSSIGTIDREMWEMTTSDTEDLICVHNLIKDNEIALAFESASGLETAVRDEIPTEVWNWMSNVWAGNIDCSSPEKIR